MRTRKLRPIGSCYCSQYKTQASFFIQSDHPSGIKLLIVKYKDGGFRGAPEFAAEVPDNWNDPAVLDLIFRPTGGPEPQYPTWEIPSRVFGSGELFRWWAGERGK